MTMVETPSSPRSKDRLFTPYMETTGKCLMLHYRCFGYVESKLRIIGKAFEQHHLLIV